jgi:hypothetical protein
MKEGGTSLWLVPPFARTGLVARAFILHPHTFSLVSAAVT